jgi:hypothetical protein
VLRFTPHYRIKRYRASAAPSANAAPPYHVARLVAGWPPALLLRPHHSITRAAPNGLRIKLSPGRAMMGRTRRGSAQARQPPSAPPSRKYPLEAIAGWWFSRSRFSLYSENRYSRTSSIRAFPNSSKRISTTNSRSRAFPIQSQAVTQSDGTSPYKRLNDIHQCPPNFSWSRPAAAFAAIRDSPRAILLPHVSVRADLSTATSGSGGEPGWPRARRWTHAVAAKRAF